MEQLQLDRIVEHLDTAFGDELPFSSGPLSTGQVDVLGEVFGDEGYQAYLQDQVNRQIIREYLINAVLLGYLPERGMSDIGEQVATREGRAALSLHMLMTSVEQAADLLASNSPENLRKLNPSAALPSYIKLVRS